MVPTLHNIPGPWLAGEDMYPNRDCLQVIGYYQSYQEDALPDFGDSSLPDGCGRCTFPACFYRDFYGTYLTCPRGD
jgi:hypothetical protein